MAFTITELETLADKYLFTGRSYKDQTFTENIFVDQLLARMLTKHSGGERISATLRYGKAPVSSYSRGDTFTRQFRELFNRADFRWKYYRVSGVAYDTDLLEIEGEEQLVDYMEGLEDNMLESLAEKLSDDLYSDGTGEAGKIFTGLGALFDQTTAAYGGISSADMSDWLAVVKTGVGSIATNLKTIKKYIMQLPKKPSLILTSQEVFSHFWDLAFDKTSVYDQILKPNGGMGRSGKRLVELGVDHVSLSGIPIIADRKMDELGDTTSAYVLNEDFLHFVGHPKRWFNKIDPKAGWKMYEDSATWYCDYGVALQMITTRRNAHLKLEDLAA